MTACIANATRRLHLARAGIATVCLCFLISRGHSSSTVSAAALSPPGMLTQSDHGAILLVHQDDWRGGLLHHLTAGAKYNHAGMLAYLDGQWMVIHSTPDRGFWGSDRDIVVVPLQVFLERSRLVRADLFSLRSPNTQLSSRAVEVAIQWAQEGREFDHSFSYATDHFLYCTELLDKAHGQAGDRLLSEPELSSPDYCSAASGAPMLTPDGVARLAKLRFARSLIVAEAPSD